MDKTSAGLAHPPSSQPSTSAAARERRREALLDEALAQSFPASDPVSITIAD